MKPQIIVLSVLAALSLTTTAFAGTAAPKVPSVKPATTSIAHTPMTPAQTHALWQAAQTKLKADHLYNGSINGERTDQTANAIRAFQSRHQLPQTGSLDYATRQALGI